MEAYEMFIIPEDCEISSKDIHMKDCIGIMMLRCGDLFNNQYNDAPSRVSTELMLGKITFNSSFEFPKQIYTLMFEYYAELNNAEKRNMMTCLRDVWNLYQDDIIKSVFDTTKDTTAIFDEYLELKKKIDDIPEEVSAEVDRMVNMNDEEFAKEFEQADEDDDDHEEQEGKDSNEEE